jgi:hypothetical protein
MRYGIDAKLFDWSDEITTDCLRKQAKNLNGQVRLTVPGSAEGGVIFWENQLYGQRGPHRDRR